MCIFTLIRVSRACRGTGLRIYLPSDIRVSRACRGTGLRIYLPSDIRVSRACRGTPASSTVALSKVVLALLARTTNQTPVSNTKQTPRSSVRLSPCAVALSKVQWLNPATFFYFFTHRLLQSGKSVYICRPFGQLSVRQQRQNVLFIDSFRCSKVGHGV
jgi:hypothetical protein